MQNIILASQSPRRKQLLEWANIPFEIIVHETDESYPADLAIEQVPVYIARQKALAVKQGLSISDRHQRTVLAADTVVILDNVIIGKPNDREHAIEILQSLSGNHHQVITGVVILYGDKEVAFNETTDVSFHPLTLDQVAYYVDHYKPYDKAGAYAIQEWIGVIGIKHINGDFYNVMGLPVSRVVQALNKLHS
ncbi:MAG: Maf family nucleotide pyrophosphatase [Chitinophagaceae bacterium]|nr:Maf family nucleotide pyrophosphatase [Chitinophagaceae bacterium]